MYHPSMNRRTFVGRMAAAAAAPFIRTSPDSTPLKANGARVNGWLSQLDAIGRTAGGINRVAYSEADLAGRQFTLGLFREAGLNPRIDAAGNIVGRLEGREPALPSILIGSHVDSVTDGGNFDGPVGSFGAIEAARSLGEQGVRLRHPLEVVGAAVRWEMAGAATLSTITLRHAGRPDRMARSSAPLRSTLFVTSSPYPPRALAARS